MVHGVTGSLVAPGSVQSLSAAIEIYLEQPARISREGRAGCERFASELEEGRYKDKITDILADLLEWPWARLPALQPVKCGED